MSLASLIARGYRIYKLNLGNTKHTTAPGSFLFNREKGKVQKFTEVVSPILQNK
jgi:hypothetical protein